MFLRIMGLCFLVAGLAFFIFVPLVRLMGGIWVGVGIILLAVDYFGVQAAKHRQLLLATGKAGRATILNVEDTGVTVNMNPRVRITVRIESDGEQPFEATKAMLVSRVSVPRIGDVYGVRYDPNKPNDFTFADDAPTQSAASAGIGAAGGSTAASAMRSALNDPALKERLRGAQNADEARAILRSALGPQADAMQINFQRRDAGAATGAPSSGPSSDVVGQLERLTALRDKGALTGSEFETEKRKLLGES